MRHLFLLVSVAAGFATAQITGGGSPLVCQTGVSAVPTLRGKGYTELTGDITLTCTGGVAPAVGGAIPQVNITVFYNTAVTSRLLPVSGVSNSISEALSLIDEPGSGLPPAVPGFGSGAGQKLCATPMQGASSMLPNYSRWNSGSYGRPPGYHVGEERVPGDCERQRRDLFWDSRLVSRQWNARFADYERSRKCQPSQRPPRFNRPPVSFPQHHGSNFLIAFRSGPDRRLCQRQLDRIGEHRRLSRTVYSANDGARRNFDLRGEL